MSKCCLKVSAIEGHGLWASSYDSQPNPLLALEGRLLPETLGDVESRTVIDVACGTGRWTARLQRMGAEVFGADACAQMLAEARRKAGLHRRLVLADAASLPFAAEAADLVVCSFAVGYLSDLQEVFAEIARVLRRSGRVVASDLHPAAVAAGWTRSFRSGSRVYEMEHFHRSVTEIVAAAATAGLEIESQQSAGFGEPERAQFIAAGKEALFSEVARIPAIWFASWTKS